MSDETLSDPEWMYVTGNDDDYTQSLAVPGGWLYARVKVDFTTEECSVPIPCVTMCFVPWAPRKGQR